MARRALPSHACLVLAVLGPGAAFAAGTAGPVEWLGATAFETGHRLGELEVGGLSGLACAAAGSPCWAISDDRSEQGPARLFTLEVDLADGRLDDGDVRLTGAVILTDPDGKAFPAGSVDPEGIALAADGSLWITSEGDVGKGVAPFLRRFTAGGRQLAEAPLPAGFLPGDGGRRGIRNNLGFEPLAPATGGGLWTGTENALVQDGAAAGLGAGSPSRLVRFDAEGRPAWQGIYWVDALDRAPREADGIAVNGLVELLALDDATLLALERAFVSGSGFRIRLYRVDLAGAANLEAADPAAGVDAAAIAPARKTLLADFSQFGRVPDNFEGMAFGPPLADGRRSLLLVSDNNFHPLQRTEFVALAAAGWGDSGPAPVVAPRVPEIQGAGHRSPLAGRPVLRVPGVVTAVAAARPGSAAHGFWMQDATGDADPATADGIFVATGPRPPGVRPGDAVEVNGWVEEDGEAPLLSSTRLGRARVEVVAGGGALPAAVPLGPGGRDVPGDPVDDDAGAAFEPASDPLDFWESLEGMRIEVRAAQVVGPSDGRGDFVVVPGGALAGAPRTPRGSPLLGSGRQNPQRLAVAAAGLAARAGQRLIEPLSGVLDSTTGRFRLVPDRLPSLAPPAEPSDGPVTRLRRAADLLTLATFNLENFSAVSSAEKLGRLAGTIAGALGGPDIVALQEVQDASGPADDGTTSAAATLERLVAAVAAAGGPSYAWVQVDPEDGADGGAPGGNIRPAFLFDPARVGVARRGAAGPRDAGRFESGPAQAGLVPNPARLAPLDPAFQSGPTPYDASRKPLALEVSFGGRRLLLVNLHLRSKWGDDPVLGAVQPPRRPSEIQRRDQAAAVHTFLEQVRAADPGTGLVVLGDFNEHEFRPPLARLAGSLLTNLVEQVPAPERYTYNYQGNAQVLDHVLVSPDLATGAEVEILHLNADLPETERASDHDPVIARLRP